jgi:outer membrane protein OmpA-like peptidoglycan-associated protein
MTDRSHTASRVVVIASLAAAIAACAPRATIVLLPEKDGRKTAVTVTQGKDNVVLDEPYAAVKTTAFGPKPYQSNPQEVEALFGPALAAQPARPAKYVVYFVENKDEFTDESKQVVDAIFTEIAKRPVPDVLVIGHTDAVGTDQVNDALGQQRAEAVRAELIRRGIAPGNIVASSRGKRDPSVQTPDGVPEPRNRLVEIVVR